jgi:uncharacterized protein (DUF433 family)
VSYGWGPDLHGSRRRVRELAVQRVRAGESPRDVALSTPEVTTADVEDWVREAQADA